MKLRITITIIIIALAVGLNAQDTLRLTLDDAIRLALTQSPEAVAVQHSYKASYWSWRSHKADYLPSLSFSSYSTLNRSISTVTLPDGSDSFMHRNQLLNEGSLTIMPQPTPCLDMPKADTK